MWRGVRILAIGVQSTLGEEKATTSFEHLMIDLAVNGGVVLALAGALSLTNSEARNRLLLADLFYGDNEDKPAIEQIQIVLEKDPLNLAALIRLADAQLGGLERVGLPADRIRTERFGPSGA